MNESTIPVIVDQPFESKGMVSPGSTMIRSIKDISNELLSQSFNRIITTVSAIIEDSKTDTKNISIDQITINLEIKGDIGFTLVGTASTGVKGAIQLVLRPKS